MPASTSREGTDPPPTGVPLPDPRSSSPNLDFTTLRPETLTLRKQWALCPLTRAWAQKTLDPDSDPHTPPSHPPPSDPARKIPPLPRWGSSPFPDLSPDALGADHFWASSLLAFPRPAFYLPAGCRRDAVLAWASSTQKCWYSAVDTSAPSSLPPAFPQPSTGL